MTTLMKPKRINWLKILLSLSLGLSIFGVVGYLSFYSTPTLEVRDQTSWQLIAIFSYLALWSAIIMTCIIAFKLKTRKMKTLAFIVILGDILFLAWMSMLGLESII